MQPDIHPARRWLKRFAWTAVAAGLVALFIWLLRPPVTEPVAFASIVVSDVDAGQVATPAFAAQDRALLERLPWTNVVEVRGATLPDSTPSATREPSGVLICHLAGQLTAYPVGGEAQLGVLSNDFRRTKLADIYSSAAGAPVWSLRSLLTSIAQQPYRHKWILLDAPRAHAEPWLAIAQADWASLLRRDVAGVRDGNIWVICIGPNALGRVDHHQRHALLVEQCARLLAEFHVASDGQPLRLRDVQDHLTKALGAPPLIVGNHGGEPDDEAIPLEFTRRASKIALLPAAEAKEPAEKQADKPEPGAAPSPPADAVWAARDALVDSGRQLGISPMDYAPASWSKLEQALVWNDWRQHTGEPEAAAAISASFLAVKPALALAESMPADRFRDALEPFPAAIERFHRAREAAWRQAPPEYVGTVRKRNYLLSRLPIYWRWRAATGAFDAARCDQDLELLRNLAEAVLEFERQPDSALAQDLQRRADELGVDALTSRIAADVQTSVAELCAKHEGTAAARLPASTQHRIEQLLLTPLPLAADRARLWKVLESTAIEPGSSGAKVAYTITPNITAQQAAVESRWAGLCARLAVNDSPNELVDLAKRLADAPVGAGWVQRWAELQLALSKRAQPAPTDAAAELFARAADAFIERDDRAGGLAPLRNWERRIAVRTEAQRIEFLGSTRQELRVDIQGASAADSTVLRFTRIPAELEVRQGETSITPSVDVSYTGQPLSFSLRYVAQRPPAGPLSLRLIAEMKPPVGDTVTSDEYGIDIVPPAEVAFELVRRDNSPLVRDAHGDTQPATPQSLPGLRLLAYPNLPSTYDIGLSQSSGPRIDAQVELYALREPFSRPQDVPTTFEQLQQVAEKLGVAVEVGGQPDVRALKFSLAAPTPPAAASPAPAASPPAAEAPQELPLPSLQLVAVITEANPGGKRHLKWLGIEPVHPEQFVQAQEINATTASGAPRLDFTLSYKGGAERDEVARPAEDVDVLLGMTDELRATVDRVNNGDTRLSARGLAPSVEFNAAPSAIEESLLHFDIAGYPRAFIWRLGNDANLNRGRLPRYVDERIRIRQPRASADPAAALPGELQFVGKPTDPIDVWVESDYPGTERWIEVGLRNSNGDRIDSHRLLGPRQYRPRLKVDELGRLTVICEVSDFHVTLAPGGTTGDATIYADLLAPDANNEAARSDSVIGVLDGVGPELPGIRPDRVFQLRPKPGEPVSVTITVEDPLSGPKRLEYWAPDSPVPVIENDAANPPGKTLLPSKPTSAAQSYTVRDFKLSFEELPQNETRIYLRAQDYAGNWSKLTSFLIDHRPMMQEEADKKGQPRDVILTVTHQGLGGQQPTRNPTVALVGADGQPGAATRGNARGVVVLKQLPPGTHKVVVSGSPRNAGLVKKDHEITVPDDGKTTPIQDQVSLD